MGKIQSLAIIGAIAVGAAVAVSLFVFYGDMMLEGTSLDPDTAGGGFEGAYMDDVGPTPGGTPQGTLP